MSKKMIQISPELFNSTNKKKKVKNKTQKLNLNSNKVKKKLMDKIQDYKEAKNKDTQDKDTQDKDTQDKEESFKGEFDKCLNFLSELPKKKNKNRSKKNKKKIHVETCLPTELLDIDTITFDKPVDKPVDKPLEELMKPEDTKTSIDPPYGIIKNGNKPTYREWKTKTQKNIKKEIPTEIKRKKEKILRKTIKHTLGKTKNKISILIKDDLTRNKIQFERKILNETSINNMKQYLIQKKLLKIGSQCPDSIIRQIYEQSILTGDVENKSFDTLLHNFKKN